VFAPVYARPANWNCRYLQTPQPRLLLQYVLNDSRHHGLYGSTSCYISQGLKYRKWQISTPHSSKTVQPILTKLETYNYLPKITRHARPHIAASTWVVCANTQIANVSFFPRLFFLFLITSACAQVAPGDRSAPKLACKCGYGQGGAIWGVSMMTNHV